MKNKYLLLLMLCLPLMIVSADMGAPVIPKYRAIVNNPNGIIINGKKLENGTEVTVSYEMYMHNSYTCEIENYGETLCSNLLPVDKDFNLNDAIKTKRIAKIDKAEVIILNPKGLDLYKGPSVIYEKVGRIAADTKFSTEYISGGDSGADTVTIASAIWLYYDNGSSKGWIYALDKNVGFGVKENEAFIPVDVTITDDEQKELFKIPANSIVKVLYNTDAWSRSYLVEYKNQKGFVSAYNIAIKVSGTITINNSKNLLSYANVNNKGIIEKLEKGSTYNFTYAYGDYGDNWYYVTSPKGNTGWIYTNSDVLDDVTLTFNTKEEVEKTTTPKKEKEETTTVPPTKKEYGIENEVTKYILIAVVLVLSAVVIMLLINKEKSQRVS